MSASAGGEATRRVKREEAAARQERLVELVDAVAIRRVLSGCPSAVEALTSLEREVVISIVDLLGADLEITAAGLGIGRKSLDLAVRRQRRRVAELTRDLMAAVMLRPAAELVEAVATGDADGVAGVLTGLDSQHLAALAVVLAAAVTDRSVLPSPVGDPAGMPMGDHAGV